MVRKNDLLEYESTTFYYALSHAWRYTILDLHVDHVGGEVQKNILSIVGSSSSGRAALSGDSKEIYCIMSRIELAGETWH